MGTGYQVIYSLGHTLINKYLTKPAENLKNAVTFSIIVDLLQINNYGKMLPEQITISKKEC